MRHRHARISGRNLAIRLLIEARDGAYTGRTVAGMLRKVMPKPGMVRDSFLRTVGEYVASALHGVVADPENLRPRRRRPKHSA